MRKIAIWMIAGTAILGTGIVVALLSGAFAQFTGSESVRPQCSQLPTKDDVATALSDNQELTSLLMKISSNIKVAATAPCGEDDRGIITVTYEIDTERDEIEEVLSTHDGYGVPLEVTHG